MMNDTIYAVASGRPPAAIAILRLSGPRALTIAEALAGTLPPSRHAQMRALRDPADGSLLDRALVLTFRAPASATGEDVVEFHLHGGRAVIAAVERAIAAQPGARGAEPGEFTRRAVLGGRIDVAQAEGLADLLTAETEHQRRVAIAAADGRVSRLAQQWASDVTALAARWEALIDFADEDDVAADPAALHVLRADTLALSAELAAVLAQPSVERVRDGIRIVLAGPANTGKSSLFNTMVQRDASIVTDVPGTTRDRVEASIQHSGVAYVVTDTAGLRDETVDPVERLGIARAREALEAADVVLWLGDSTPPPIKDRTVILLHARCDVPDRRTGPTGRLGVSAKTGNGIKELWDAIRTRSTHLLPQLDQVAVNERQSGLIGQARDEIALAADERDILLVAEHIQFARRALDRITGLASTDDMLTALFSRFCIGK